MNLDKLHTTPHPDMVSTIVYAAQSSDVETVWIDGRLVLRDGRLTTMDERLVIEAARNEAARLAAIKHLRTVLDAPKLYGGIAGGSGAP